MKKTIPTLILFYLACVPAFSQQRQIDSLSLLLKNATHDTTRAFLHVALTEYLYIPKPDTVIPLCKKALQIIDKNISTATKQERHSYLFTKASALNNIAFIYHIKGDEEKALDNFLQALKINEEIDSKREIANCLSNLGTIYDSQGHPEIALDYLLRALKIQEQLGVKDAIAFSLNNIAAVYEKQAQFEKALEFTHRSLKLHEETGNKYGAATALNNLGALYAKQSQFKKALDYYNQSLKIREAMDDKQGIATCLHNIGYVYEATGEKDKALDYNFRGLKIYEAIADKRGIANSYHNIGAIYDKDGNSAKAIEYYTKGIAMYEDMGDKRGLGNSLNNMGEALLRQGKAPQGLPFVNRAFNVASEAGYVEQIRTAHYLFARIDSAMGNYAGSYMHYKLYRKYQDSLSNVQTRKIALKKQLQHEYEKKEAAIRLEQEKKDVLNQEALKRENLIKWSLLGIMGLSFLSCLLLFNRYRLKQQNKLQEQINLQQKEQANAVLEVQEQERKRIAEDLHDSLGHLLSTVKLNLQASPFEQKQVDNTLQLVNQAGEEIRNITFNLMPRTLEEGGLVPALNELASKISSTNRVKVLLNTHDMDRFNLEKQSQFSIYRIIQEAVNNILKHADASEISIQLVGQKDHITIMIEDDGKGFTPGKNTPGRGLKNIVTRSLWLKGNVNIDSSPGRGTTITTEIPVQ